MNFISLAIVAITFLYPSIARAQDNLTLQQVFHYVLQTNPAILSARADLMATKEMHEQALAGWRPNIDGDASIYASDIDNSNFGRSDGTVTKDLSINMEQPLYRGGQTTAEIAKAKALISAAEARNKRIEQNELYKAVQAYMNVVHERNIYDLYVANEAYLEEEYKATQEKLDAGLLTKTDLQQAKARLARSKANRASAAANVDAAHAAFEENTGMPALHGFTYIDTSLNIPNSIDIALSEANSYNPDIIAATYSLEAAEHDVDRTLAALYPQIFAFASLNKQFDPQPGIIDDAETRTIGVRASIPLYDGGVIRSRTRQAEYSVDQRRHDIEAVHRRLKADITTKWKQWQAAKAETEQRHVEIESAEMALEGVKEEARLGERTILDILNADQELLQSRSGLATARRNEILAQYALAATLNILGSD